ncbi:MAG: phosphoribosylformylglycinamidine cyclo-ligase [Arcanobacterium sp.]|nr:phosphoribosylformylglycinamidine cyclo-ligase [Arcanobacterium sp.]
MSQPAEVHTPTSVAGAAYAAAGVDLERGYEVVRRIRSSVDSTRRPGMMGGIGGFGGMFDLKAAGYHDPVLVSGTDGVGTKLFLAFQTGIHSTVGIDAVAMCVNDVIAQGAEPLFFLDYVAIPTAEPTVVADIVHGIATACAESGCALVGGETAEMNDLYEAGTYDIAGFCVAAVERTKMITGAATQPGDVLLGLPSSGPHSNGYSLLRKVFFKDHDFTVDSLLPELATLTSPSGSPLPLGEVLLTPTTLYVQPVLALLRSGISPHGMANITGGGFFENIPRMNGDLSYHIQLGSWPELPIFPLVQSLSGLQRNAMFNVFNMGIGFVLALAPDDVPAAQEVLRTAGTESYVIGTVSAGEPETESGKGVHLHE